MKTKDQLLDECLVSLEDGTTTLEECVERYFAADPDAADTLRATVALRTVAAPAHEAAMARERVRMLLSEQISAASVADGPAVAGSQRTAAWRHGARRKLGRWRSLALVAAVFLVCALGIWQALNAAGTALPDSPLYGVKRGGEWIELRSAWSDERRGQVLAAIAAQRLAEARAAAALHHDAMVRSLTRELDSTMGQLIALTAQMEAKHENATTVVRALAHVLDAEHAATQSASRAGQSALAQALATSTTAQQRAIKQYDISLPSGDGGPRGSPPDVLSAPPPGHGSPATPPAAPSATPPTSHGGNDNGGSGLGGSNGQAGDNSQRGGGGHGGHGSGGRADPATGQGSQQRAASQPPLVRSSRRLDGEAMRKPSP